ncbi:TPA: hypothetical protein R4341_000745 [Pasteurella multocida]|nr:hypothetical protein [Pasteurella multocida]HDR1409398.1 hypothetical protein [Pasteurella multocida]HDR1409885.1 hypothetical protein [Pasteurella multocida]HDR1605756.1 hypothetical protein [Pasteurella multocida]HDR1877265.1 hypothetical protein [Pasteurella multocida]
MMNTNNNLNLQEASFNQNRDIALVVEHLLKNNIMPTMDIGNHHWKTDPMITQQLSSLESYCKDNFAGQKATVQQLSETTTRHERKIDKLVEDVAVVNARTAEHLATKADLAHLKTDLTEKISAKIRTLNDKLSTESEKLNDKISAETKSLSDKASSNFRWLLFGFIIAATTVCGAMYALLRHTESDIKSSIAELKTEIRETQKNYDKLNQEAIEIKKSNQEILNAISDIKSFQQEKKLTASNTK